MNPRTRKSGRTSKSIGSGSGERTLARNAVDDTRQHVAEGGAQAGQQDALRQQLPHQAAAACPDGEADSDFVLPRGGARQQQVRHVGAGDQEQQSDKDGQGGHQQHDGVVDFGNLPDLLQVFMGTNFLLFSCSALMRALMTFTAAAPVRG